MQDAETGCSYSTGIGTQTGKYSSGSGSVYIGNLAGTYNSGDNSLGIGARSLYNNSGSECIAIGYQQLMDNSKSQLFSVGQAKINPIPLMVGNFTNGHVGINCTEPNVDYMLDVNGDIECESLDEVSDIRAKTLISTLGKNKVKQFCENVTIWGFLWNEYGYNSYNETHCYTYEVFNYSYFDEELNESVMVYDNVTECYNETIFTDLYFGEPTDDFDIGIPAQLLFNYVKNTFGEEFAHAIVYVPEDESTELWNVNYKSVSLIFARYSQIIANELKQLEDRVDAMEEFLMQYGYVPPE